MNMREIAAHVKTTSINILVQRRLQNLVLAVLLMFDDDNNLRVDLRYVSI